MTECNGCGSCCDPVMMPYDLDFVRANPQSFLPADRRWMLSDLTPMSERQARSKEPNFLRSLRVQRLLHWLLRDEEFHFFSCSNFDAETRQCLIYAQRPPICRKYPWIGGQPVPGTPLPPTCSYRADIGQPVKLMAKP